IQKGLTRAEFAKKSNLNAKTVESFERGGSTNFVFIFDYLAILDDQEQSDFLAKLFKGENENGEKRNQD
ncbi:UNVERIFIED_CONTAM: hypothetical protein RF648_19595, partial [Kocuria sp. CPCC 205274]